MDEDMAYDGPGPSGLQPAFEQQQQPQQLDPNRKQLYAPLFTTGDTL